MRRIECGTAFDGAKQSTLNFSVSKMACLVFVICAVTVIVAPAQTFKRLYSFCSQANCSDGNTPFSGLIQANDGNLYGMTFYGGFYDLSCGYNGCGTVFKIAPAGMLTTLYTFCSQVYCKDGSDPNAQLIQAADGNFYGLATQGGAYADGTVFKITPNGRLSTLHSFNWTDGYQPGAGLIQASDGSFYGITSSGGSQGAGTIFKITPAGTLTTLYSFCSQANCADGSEPAVALIPATDGSFYGTTWYGGSYDAGTIFKITPAGTLVTLHSFTLQGDGMGPNALIQGNDGNFYGTTATGGAQASGTIFKITPAGTLSTLYSFSGSADGIGPVALVQASDGNFYGTTSGGGNGYGTVFRSTPAGILTRLHVFDGTDGWGPYAIMQATNGGFYGTTSGGGFYNYGTVFQLSVGLAPFVKAQPSSGVVGAAINILGTNLTGATGVMFNRTPAKFTLVSSSEIATTVPAGATTGSVAVTMLTGRLKSDVVFRVTPQLLSFAPPSGSVGTVVTITGVSLTQTESVAFGAVKATQFSVISDTEVQATVPVGAKTGHITLRTLGGIAGSSDTFTVTQ